MKVNGILLGEGQLYAAKSLKPSRLHQSRALSALGPAGSSDPAAASPQGNEKALKITGVITSAGEPLIARVDGNRVAA